jgi:hypothetical protein
VLVYGIKVKVERGRDAVKTSRQPTLSFGLKATAKCLQKKWITKLGSEEWRRR